MRKHVLAALIACGALMLAVAPAVFAAPTPVTDGTAVNDGKPDINADSPTGYYIWHDDGGFHLRTHGPHARHDFDAVLHTDGTFENVDPVRLEDGDRVDLVDGGHGLSIHFNTFDFTDGVNFTLRDAEHLRFNLRLDGTHIATDHIFLGSHGAHPKNNPFTIRL
jgi:hypothetical protein